MQIQEQKHAEQVRSSLVTDDLMNKIRELNGALLDNRKLMDIIQRITNEKKSLENMLIQLKNDEPDRVNYTELSTRVIILISPYNYVER